MATRYYPSTALLPADPLAPSRFEQSKADCAAAHFELTEREYRRWSPLSVEARAWALELRLQEFDNNRRPIIGVWGSLGGPAEKQFWADWRANRDANMQRAWDAFERAEERWGDDCTARPAESYIAPGGLAA